MVGMKITRQRGGQHKNNSPKGMDSTKITRQKGWTDGGSYDRHDSNSPKDGELNQSYGRMET